LLKALPLVKERFPDITLDVIGVGPQGDGEGLRALCSQLQIGPRVTFLGRQAAPEIARRHLQAQVFVLPSENENSPNALAEAMVSGMPVIASDAGGIPSMVADGETGLLVPPQNPVRLGEAILRLLEHADERARLGQNARRIARERHQPESVAGQTVAAYREILRLDAGAHG
jgi:glycosyltransferase involved in cell wall biosynthesis